ncbi:SGNH/GDSL hydrolase family protein [Streptomyces hoynatensis]|uniref:SGNH/GDSL hydrolase family protein n=1 Tax=Streptomyces hoynatensis TaxID=1141874 RepID=A0A3A9Z9M4_9ACTN|nr:SGNH/GDSL hydrolase family protein [Streptomyces hoynatensis]RKN44973.1 SGNH/GDSL hydrolase family protein [Streptomyces hoynatensis]
MHRVKWSRAVVVGVSALAAALLPAAPPAAADDGYAWAALGDSYTAGLFAGDPQPALGDAGRDGCDRTDGAYPSLVNRELDEFPPGRPVTLTNVSCASATVPQIARESQRPASPVQPPRGDPANWPQVPAQAERAGLGEDTDVITIGAGAGSLPLDELLSTCASLGAEGRSCREHYENPPEGQESLDDRFARLQGEYIEMLAEVHGKAAHARVITVGYPAIFPQDASGCAFGDLTRFGTIRADDITWLREVLERTNTTLRTVTDFFGDRYADAYAVSDGHDACRSQDERWIEGFCGTAADSWPTALPGLPATCPAGTRATLAHPNTAGHEATAQVVERAIRIALLSS